MGDLVNRLKRISFGGFQSLFPIQIISCAIYPCRFTVRKGATPKHLRVIFFLSFVLKADGLTSVDCAIHQSLSGFFFLRRRRKFFKLFSSHRHRRPKCSQFFLFLFFFLSFHPLLLPALNHAVGLRDFWKGRRFLTVESGSAAAVYVSLPFLLMYRWESS